VLNYRLNVLRSMSLASNKKPKSAFVAVTDFLDEHAPPDAHIVRQTASQFLVSTLPPALRTSSADTLLEKINSTTQESESILDYLSITYDETKPVQERCPAIERLASARVSLDRVDVGRLLEDKEPDIRKYALGLIGNSPDRDDLVKFAQDLSSKNSDSDFQNETELLVQLLSQESP